MAGIKLTDEDRKCYLYRAFLKEDPTKDYVGITVNFKKRKRDHRRDAKNGTGKVFARALAKYGFTNFEWTVLSICRSRKVAADLEIFCRKFLKLGSYNLTDGGEGAEGITLENRLGKSLHMKNMWKDQRQYLLDGMARRWEDPEEKKYFGSVMSEVRSEPEAKEKHRKMMLAKHQEPDYSSKIGKKVSEYWKEHQYPEEARAKLSLAKTGLKRTDAHIENQRNSFKKNRELGLNLDPQETRTKKSESQKLRHIKEKADQEEWSLLQGQKLVRINLLCLESRGNGLKSTRKRKPKTPEQIEKWSKTYEANKLSGLHINATKESLKRRSDAQKIRQAKETAEGRKPISETTRQRQSEAQRARFARERSGNN